jgi:hypothetical protein
MTITTVSHYGKVAQAMNAVQQFKPKHGEHKGTMRCTKCGSSLSFSIMSNGLSRGSCRSACGVKWTQ